MMKKLLALLLCLVMVVSLAMPAVYADEGSAPQDQVSQEPVANEPVQQPSNEDNNEPSDEDNEESGDNSGSTDSSEPEMFVAEVAMAFDEINSESEAVIYNADGTTIDHQGTLAECVSAAANGETIIVLKDITQSSRLVIENKSITIKDNGSAVTIRLQNSTGGYAYSRCGIYVKAGAGLTLVGSQDGYLTISGKSEEISGSDYTYNKGSLLYISGTLTTSNVTITDETNSGDHGAGIYVYSGSATINSGTIISECHVSSDSNNGGGVYVSASGTLTINSGTISNCSAKYGGGVYCAGTFIMNGGTISKCTANNGTAIYVSAGSTVTIAAGTVSEDDQAQNLIYAYSTTEDKIAKVSISGGEICGKLTKNTTAPTYSYYEISGGEFTKKPNTSYLASGATITATNETNGPWRVIPPVAKIGTTGYSSLSEAISAANTDDTIVLLKDITITEKQLVSKKITITNNEKTDVTIRLQIPVGDDGSSTTYSRGIQVNSSTAELTLLGGSTGSLTVTGKSEVAIENEYTYNAGPLLCVYKGKLITRNVTITGANQSLRDGGAIEVYSDNAVLDDGTEISCCCVDNNKILGGAVYVKDTGNLTINSGVSISNCSAKNGGAIYCLGTATITGCSFYENMTSAGGGAIYNKGTLTATNCSFSKNSANAGGGAILNAGESGELNITSCTFAKTEADRNSAAATNDSGLINGKDVNIANGTANFTGVSAVNICLSRSATFSGLIDVDEIFLYDIDEGNAQIVVSDALSTGSQFGIRIINGELKTAASGNSTAVYYPNRLINGTQVISGSNSEAVQTAVKCAMLLNEKSPVGLGYDGKLSSVYFTEKNMLNLSSDLKFGFGFTNGSDSNNLKVKFTMAGTEKVVNSISTEEGKTYFFFDGLAPQCIGTPIKAELYVDDVKIDECTKSILDYAKALYENGGASENLKNLVRDLVDYGIAANAYVATKEGTVKGTSYSRSDCTWLDKAAVTADVPSDFTYSIVKNGTLEGCNFILANVIYSVDNTMYVKFKMTGDAKLLVNDKEIEDTDANLVSLGNDEYIYYVKGIKAINITNPYTFVLKDGDNTLTLNYGISQYARSKMQSASDVMKSLAIATYNFGVSAKTYANVPNS